MTLYAVTVLGSNLSQFAAGDDAQDEAIRSLERGSSEPTVKVAGLLHNTTGGTVLTGLSSGLGEALARWNGSAWTLFADPTKACINNGGTIAYAANQPMGSHKLTGLAAGSTAGDSVRYEQVVLTSGANAMAADLDLGTHKIINVVDPTSNQHAATKKYVDDNASKAAAGPITGITNAGWTNVSLGWDYTAVHLVLQSSANASMEQPADDYTYAIPSWIILASDGGSTISKTYARGGYVLEFEKQTNGFRVRLNALNSDTLGLRYFAIR